MNNQEIEKILLQFVNQNKEIHDKYQGNEGSNDSDILDEDEINIIAVLNGCSGVNNQIDGYSVYVEEHDSGDGDGGETFIVIKIVDMTSPVITYVQFTGRRSSYDSDYWNMSFCMVEPRMVEVRQWFPAGVTK